MGRIIRQIRPKGVWLALYCMTEGPRMPVKIGRSVRPHERLRRLQGETWREMQIAWTVPAEIHHERQAHDVLSRLHLRGEWFSDPQDMIKNLRVATATEVVVALSASFAGAA